jgi:hypothetical protein
MNATRVRKPMTSMETVEARRQLSGVESASENGSKKMTRPAARRKTPRPGGD